MLGVGLERGPVVSLTSSALDGVYTHEGRAESIQTLWIFKTLFPLVLGSEERGIFKARPARFGGLRCGRRELGVVRSCYMIMVC